MTFNKNKKKYISLKELSSNKKYKINLPKSTLHYWLKKDLIKPSYIKGKTGMYNLGDILDRINMIKFYQERNFNLKDIKVILNNKDY